MSPHDTVRSDLHDYLCRHDYGVPARTLVEEVLHIYGVSEAMCRKLVKTAVGADRRFVAGRQGLWRLRPDPLAEQPLRAAPVTLVHVQHAMSARARQTPVELAAQRFEGPAPGPTLHLLIKPLEAIAPEGTRATGLRRSDLGRGQSLSSATERLCRLAEGSLWVAWRAGALASTLAHLAAPQAKSMLCLHKLAARVWLEQPLESLADLAAQCGLPWPELRRAGPGLGVVVEAFARMLDGLESQGVATVADALRFQETPRQEVDFEPYAFDPDTLASLPRSPGVYTMADANGQIIYVGKAKDLRERVGHYFAATAFRDAKTQGILDAVRDLRVEQTPTEVEALVREAELIAQHRPRFNTQMAVHEREAAYAKGSRLVLLCPSAEQGVDVLCTSRGRLLERLTLCEEDLDAEDLTAAIESLYFAAAVREPAADASRELVASWVEANRHRALTVDVDLCEGAAHVAQLVVEYACDLFEGRPRAFRL